MALILRSTIPKALMIISSELSKVESAILILESCKNNNISIENTLATERNFIYTARNINEIVEKMQKDYKQDCCNECSNY